MAQSFWFQALMNGTFAADTFFILRLVALMVVDWLVDCLTSQQHASVYQGRMCSENFTCCHTEIEVANQTFHLTQSQYTATGPTSPSVDPMTSGAWQGWPLECQFLSHWSWKDPRRKRESTQVRRCRGGYLTTRPKRLYTR